MDGRQMFMVLSPTRKPTPNRAARPRRAEDEAAVAAVMADNEAIDEMTEETGEVPAEGGN
jgi:hypothetical protein